VIAEPLPTALSFLFQSSVLNSILPSDFVFVLS